MLSTPTEFLNECHKIVPAKSKWLKLTCKWTGKFSSSRLNRLDRPKYLRRTYFYIPAPDRKKYISKMERKTRWRWRGDGKQGQRGQSSIIKKIIGGHDRCWWRAVSPGRWLFHGVMIFWPVLVNIFYFMDRYFVLYRTRWRDRRPCGSVMVAGSRRRRQAEPSRDAAGRKVNDFLNESAIQRDFPRITPDLAGLFDTRWDSLKRAGIFRDFPGFSGIFNDSFVSFESDAVMLYGIVSGKSNQPVMPFWTWMMNGIEIGLTHIRRFS